VKETNEKSGNKNGYGNDWRKHDPQGNYEQSIEQKNRADNPHS